MSYSPHYFKTCKISATALIKMACSVYLYQMLSNLAGTQVIHARSGVPYEIMGLMQGKIMGSSIVILDSFALPVQGTETRVSAADEANEYLVQYLDLGGKVSSVFILPFHLIDLTVLKVGRHENVVGWYHSHPGYGCWLSGIDVSTQLTNQKFQDPFVAVVVSFL